LWALQERIWEEGGRGGMEAASAAAAAATEADLRRKDSQMKNRSICQKTNKSCS
jgi:hypothetical protein